jgi:tetraprenyl-beta-curcumene synthase
MSSRHPGARRAALRDTGSLLAVVARYWVTVFPVVRDEIARWGRRAKAIPDRVLCCHAREALAGERMNAEGAAIFAVLSGPRHCAAVARLLVRFQVMYDYLDTLSEQPVALPLENGRRLHRALAAAVGARPPRGGYYLHHSQRDDGGYLDALVGACRSTFQRLPGAGCVAPALRRAVHRSAEGQSRNHAWMAHDGGGFVGWASALAPQDSGLQWWENGAAAGSSLAIHALLASAGNPAITTEGAAQIAAAYWPWVNALNTLLESLVDRRADIATGNHSYVSHYATPEAMARGLGTIARHAADAMRDLPDARQHAAILAAMASFYLSAPEAAVPDARAVVLRVQSELDTDLRLLLAMLRLRRRLSGGTPASPLRSLEFPP